MSFKTVSSLGILLLLGNVVLADESPIDKRVKPQRILSNDAGEGPAWHPTRGLYFSGPRGITRISPTGAMQPFRYPSGGSNGLLFDHEGRLIICEAGRRRVTRTEPNGRTTVLADGWEGKRFNTPNDLAIDSKGRIYFSDPRYGNREDMEIVDEDSKQIEGVYRIDGPRQVTRIITHEVDRPNGLLITPDDKYLFVADNNNNSVGGARSLYRFDLTPEGEIVADSRKLIFDWETGRGPDGMAMDQQGRLFVAGGLNRANPPYETADRRKGGIYVLTQDGDLLDFVPILNDEVTNCIFGDRDMKTLYVTAGGQLWKVRVNVPGWSPGRSPNN